jgi:hypothetical protein
MWSTKYYLVLELKKNVGGPTFKNDLRVETVAMRWLMAQRKGLYCQQKTEGVISDTERVSVKEVVMRIVCGAAAHSGPFRLIVEVSRSHKHTQARTDTHTR